MGHILSSIFIQDSHSIITLVVGDCCAHLLRRIGDEDTAAVFLKISTVDLIFEKTSNIIVFDSPSSYDKFVC